MDKSLLLGQFAILLALLSPLGNLSSQLLVMSMGLWAAFVFGGGYALGILAIVGLHFIKKERRQLMEEAYSRFNDAVLEVHGPSPYGWNREGPD
jgi:ABC-type transport system involved in multi-copper enzyme maturation permease subunit